LLHLIKLKSVLPEESPRENLEPECDSNSLSKIIILSQTLNGLKVWNGFIWARKVFNGKVFSALH
jgi:hypothetical protein